jgi:hypothetical protein
VAFTALVDRAAVLDDMRVRAEEALRFRVGLSLMECSGQCAHNNCDAYDYPHTLAEAASKKSTLSAGLEWRRSPTIFSTLARIA